MSNNIIASIQLEGDQGLFKLLHEGKEVIITLTMHKDEAEQKIVQLLKGFRKIQEEVTPPSNLEEAQPQVTETFDLLKLGEVQKEPLDRSMMEVNEKPLDLSMMLMNEGQTEILDLSIPKVNIKEAEDLCDISIQKAENEKEMTSSLEEHVRTYANERPYSCLNREKSFTRTKIFKGHIRIHSECGKNFTQRKLEKHLQIYHGMNPYSCLECGKIFDQKWKLERHIQSHRGNKSYSCPNCEKNFTEKAGALVNGKDAESRLLRRTMARYLCLTQLLIYRDISIRVRKRFPTYDSIIKAGFMLENECEMLESIQLDFDKYWVPINWIYALIFRGRKDGKIVSDAFANKLCDEVKNFRHHLQILCNYDWVPIPLAYPQLVFLAVYVYFAICLISRQFIITELDVPNKSNIDLILPCVTMMEFIIFVGWMKVAEGLLNPFGEDDDDFETNFLLDKNFAVSLCIVDDASDDAPELEKDQFWPSDEVNEVYLQESIDNIIKPSVRYATLSF
ncbi:Bestrophin-1 [Dirofilaria immitis]|nr:Bestrophin-1 [Dirofilaria immitis]